MNCRRAMRLSISGKNCGNPELEEHLAACTRCRQLRAIILDLERLGGEQRQADLSPDSIRETRSLAAAALAGRPDQAANVNAAPSVISLWRPVLATCAAAVLVAAVAFAWLRSWHGPASKTAPLSASEMTALDKRIDLLAQRVGDDLRGFRDRHRDREIPTGLEAISASLKIEIASSVMHVDVE